MEGRDLSDSQILDLTKLENEDGKSRLSIVLPGSEVVLTSEWMDLDSARKHMIQWCEHVRQQVDAHNLKEERGLPDTPAKKREEPVVDESPLAYATKMRDKYQGKVRVLEQEIEDLQSERSTVRTLLEDWERVLNALRGELDDE